MYKITITTLACLFSVLAANSFAFIESKPLPKTDAFKVIQIAGEDIPKAIGEEIKNLSLAAVIDEVMEPIPFQIDEYNVGGAVYFEGWEVELDGTKDVFDNSDKILFVYKDAGPRKTSRQIFDGELVAEIELSGADNQRRYVYLVKNSKLRSQEQYVRYSSEHARVESDFYSLTYNKENHLKWEDFSVKSFIGEPPLDSMKIRIHGGIITPYTTSTLNNEDLIALPAGEVVGPIRSTTQLEVTVWLFNVPMLTLGLQQHHLPKAILYDVRTQIPSVRRKLLVDPTVTVSLEGNKLLGASIHSALGPEIGGIVDGTVDNIEQQMIESGINLEHNWIWVSTKRNLDIVAMFDFLAETKEPITLQIQDSFDNLDPPERYPGQLPNVGYVINDLPPTGFFGCVISLFLDNQFEGHPEAFTESLRSTHAIRINTL